ncbi:D-alanine--D-alanine ligase [Arachidicoccus sp.]|uniref:D-alanine--D-alanine ligase n=1 Tax=Arachidicoccus sp. TaxID=1872624 RepID=UPI003D1FCD40
MKKKIALITGGYSGEAVISYQSADNILHHIDKSKYEIFKIDISKKGWFYTNEKNEAIAIARGDFSIENQGEKILFDIALMCIHGSPGEDGKLLGYLDMIGLPYTSCNAAVSALTFNKRHTVAVAGLSGIDVAKSILLYNTDPINIDEIKALQFPVFVKPNNGGSSIGMSKVLEKNDQAITTAIAKAFAEDNQVLIEEYIKGREFTIGVLRNIDGEIITLPMTEIILKKGRDHFDFEAKYNGETGEITPAEVSREIAKKVALTAKKAYQVLGCSGVVRIDFIYNVATDRPVMLEVNTVPGQTKESLVPKQVLANGWTLEEFYTQLIETALAQ